MRLLGTRGDLPSTNDRRLSGSLGNQAVILQATGDLDGALKEEEAIFRRLNDPAGLSVSLGNQALILAGHRGPRR